MKISIYDDGQIEKQTIPGDFNEAQILEAGRRYMDRCLEFFSSSLHLSLVSSFVNVQHVHHKADCAGKHPQRLVPCVPL